MEHNGAPDRQQLRGRDNQADAKMLHVPGDQRVPFRPPKARDAQVGEQPVEDLRAKEQDQNDIAKS
jgi:hypothetical protein